LAALTDTIEGYEWQRWPLGKTGRQRIVSVISRGAKDKARREGQIMHTRLGAYDGVRMSGFDGIC